MICRIDPEGPGEVGAIVSDAVGLNSGGGICVGICVCVAGINVGGAVTGGWICAGGVQAKSNDPMTIRKTNRFFVDILILHCDRL